MGVPTNANLAGPRGPLKRTQPCPDLPADKLHHPSPPSYNRTLRYYKEQRNLSNRHKQRKLLSLSSEPTDPPPPPSPRPQHATLSQNPPPPPMPHAPRTSSPLSPTSNPYQIQNYNYNNRRSTKKAQPDLHKQAIFTRMRCNPEGARILHMGPRLALSIMEATRDLERLVGGYGPGFGTAVEIDPTKDSSCSVESPMSTTAILTQSWVMISADLQSHSEWEMLTC
ncbi:hypothetical protein E1B28_011667 [Marasmius oreades]|uniref:Uncharacterized protein n=1 Tax=Marasmius oreades TaxID=181124 RepID=A0A9P7UQ71_9AGAR|nr:uncharacterized protein E1B28_011667 [Marasmius oreades]KAG7090048.1 hypothetical protein E1B28_011667 [Marasmius oreades]